MNSQESEGTITLTLDKNEAGVAFAALKDYEKMVLESGPRRIIVQLMTGVDPFEVAQTVRKAIDAAGAAAWGGEVEDTYGEPDAEPDPA